MFQGTRDYSSVFGNQLSSEVSSLINVQELHQGINRNNHGGLNDEFS